jgi:hypothetical protein
MNATEVTADWFGEVLSNRYPGIRVESMETIELINTHTTKLRVAVTFNEVGEAAQLPHQLCLKANFTGRANPLDICVVEARFYHDLVEGLVAGDDVPIPRCYYSDWDDNGSGQGLSVQQDLHLLGGEFGNSYQRIGVGAVAQALSDMAELHGRYWADPKITTLGQRTVTRWLRPGLRAALAGGFSGGGFESDFVAEGLQACDVVAGLAAGVDALVVEVGSEVVERGVGVG